MNTKEQIEVKRQEVRRVYANSGMSAQYHKLFDEMQEMNRDYMTQLYRQAPGGSPGTRTQFDRAGS